MDAVDAALVAFGGGSATIVATRSAPIPDGMKRELHALAQDPSGAAIRFWHADARLGSMFASAALDLLESAGVDARESDGDRQPRPDRVPRTGGDAAMHRAARRSERHRRAHGHHHGGRLQAARHGGRRRGRTSGPGVSSGDVFRAGRRAGDPQSGGHREPVGARRGPGPAVARFRHRPREHTPGRLCAGPVRCRHGPRCRHRKRGRSGAVPPRRVPGRAVLRTGAAEEHRPGALQPGVARRPPCRPSGGRAARICSVRYAI